MKVTIVAIATMATLRGGWGFVVSRHLLSVQLKRKEKKVSICVSAMVFIKNQQ